MENADLLARLGSARRYPDLERLICAAALNPDLATRLLSDPAAALDLPEYVFRISPAERALILSIQGASDIYEFASRLHEAIQQRG